MAKEKVVVAKRGCTCCGTGCAIPLVIVPSFTFLLSGVLGLAVALALSLPLTLAAMHGPAFFARHTT